jgi:hypothetical protein
VAPQRHTDPGHACCRRGSFDLLAHVHPTKSARAACQDASPPEPVAAAAAPQPQLLAAAAAAARAQFPEPPPFVPQPGLFQFGAQPMPGLPLRPGNFMAALPSAPASMGFVPMIWGNAFLPGVYVPAQPHMHAIMMQSLAHGWTTPAAFAPRTSGHTQHRVQAG